MKLNQLQHETQSMLKNVDRTLQNLNIELSLDWEIYKTKLITK